MQQASAFYYQQIPGFVSGCKNGFIFVCLLYDSKNESISDYFVWIDRFLKKLLSLDNIFWGKNDKRERILCKVAV